MCFIQNPICFVGLRWQKRWWFCYCHMFGTFCAGKDFALITFSFNCLARDRIFLIWTISSKVENLTETENLVMWQSPLEFPGAGAYGRCPASHHVSSSPECPWDGRRGEEAAGESPESMSLPSKQFCRAQHLLQLQMPSLVPFVSAVMPLPF